MSNAAASIQKLEHSRITQNKPFDVVVHWAGELHFPVDVMCKLIPQKNPLEARKTEYDLARRTLQARTNPITLADLTNADTALAAEKNETDVVLWVSLKDTDGTIVSSWKESVLYESELSYSKRADVQCPLYPQSYVDYYTCTGQYAEVIFYMKDRNGRTLDQGTKVRVNVHEMHNGGNDVSRVITPSVTKDGFIVITPDWYSWNKSYTFRIMDSELLTHQAEPTELAVVTPPPKLWQNNSPVKSSNIQVTSKYVDYHAYDGAHAHAYWKFKAVDGKPIDKGTYIVFNVHEEHHGGNVKDYTIESEIRPDGTILLQPGWYSWNKSFTYSVQETSRSHHIFVGEKAELFLSKPPPKGWQKDSPVKAANIRVKSKRIVEGSSGRYALWSFATDDGKPVDKGTHILVNVHEVHANDNFKDSTIEVEVRQDGTIMVQPGWYSWNKSYTYSIEQTLYSHNVFVGDKAPLTISKD